MNLLEKAKAENLKKPPAISQDEINMAFAFLRNEISVTQVSKAYNKRNNIAGCMYRLINALKLAYERGEVALKE